MKRVQDLIISGLGTGTGGELDATMTLANFASATEGDVNIIDPSTGIAWATGGASAVVIRACADSDGNAYVRQSLPLLKGHIKSYIHKDYAVATAKTITVTIPATTPVAGDVYEMFITDYNDAQYIVGRRRIAYEAIATDTNATALAVGLTAQINSDDSIPNVSATNAAGVITIVGAAVSGSGNVMSKFRANFEVLFNVALAENMAGLSVVAVTVNAFKGCGTYRGVLKLEEIYKGYKGFTNRVWNSATISNIRYDANSAGTYDLITIMHDQPQHTNNEGSVPAQVSTIIAMDSAVAGGGDAFETAMDLVMAELY